MALYRPPLRLNSRIDDNTAPTIKDALKGIKIEFYYTGKRIGKEIINLSVCTFIEDESENLFFRLSTYSGLKETWKEVILNQIKQQLRDLEVEEGFVRSETRYLVVSPEQHLTIEDFQKKQDSLQRKVDKKKH